MELKKPLRLSLVSQVAEEIETLIQQDVWLPGDKLPGEIELVEQFGVSRNTIREALQSLVSVGILEARQGSGTYVLSKSRFDASLRNHLQNVRLQDVIEVRLILETQIVSIAAHQCQEEDKQLLAIALNKRNQPFEDNKQFIEADLQFHLELARLCHNKLLFDLYHSLLYFLNELICVYLQYSNQDVQSEQHTRLFQAVKMGDALAAQHEVEALVQMEKDTFLKAHLIINE